MRATVAFDAAAPPRDEVKPLAIDHDRAVFHAAADAEAAAVFYEWGAAALYDPIVPATPADSPALQAVEEDVFHDCLSDDALSDVSAEMEPPGAVPLEWQPAFEEFLSEQPPLPSPTVALPPPPELFLEIPLLNLADLVDMHSAGLAVNWPQGVNLDLAVLALQLRRSEEDSDEDL